MNEYHRQFVTHSIGHNKGTDDALMNKQLQSGEPLERLAKSARIVAEALVNLAQRH
jgi:hypothetical protein